MPARVYLLIFAGLVAAQVATYPAAYRRLPPRTADAAEVFDIGLSLARGHGYRFDWDDPAFRRAYAEQNGGDPVARPRPAAAPAGPYDLVLARRGSYPTLSRPPLMPVLVAACVLACPHLGDVFLAWRAVDMALCAAATTLLCGAAAAAARGRRGGAATAVVAVLAAFAFDPVRWPYVPGWWTEGLAFDLTAVGCWLLADGRRVLRTPRRYHLAAGLTLGLLCLDRAAFVLLIPPLAALLATGARGGGGGDPARRRMAWGPAAVAIGAVAVALQVPWWARNVAVAGRFVPLGTQGGFNLPDEYGPEPVATGGVWDGLGIRDAWLPDDPPGRPVPLPPGFTEDRFARLTLGDRRWHALIVAATCTSTASEVAVADVGTRFAARWVAAHPGRVPGLVAAKLWSLTEGARALLAAAAVATAGGYWRSPPAGRRLLRQLLAWVGCYAAAVALTHVVTGRFLVPALPPIYLAVAVSAAAILRPAKPAPPDPASSDPAPAYGPA